MALYENSLKLTSEQFATISDQISQWEATYRKSKPSIQIERGYLSVAEKV